MLIPGQGRVPLWRSFRYTPTCRPLPAPEIETYSCAKYFQQGWGVFAELDFLAGCPWSASAIGNGPDSIRFNSVATVFAGQPLRRAGPRGVTSSG